MPLNWNTTKEDDALITKIVDRAMCLYPEGVTVSKIDLSMDLAACHANGCALKLAELAEAEDFDLLHDVAGIHRHLNRQTGELEDCFLPRFAAPTA